MGLFKHLPTTSQADVSQNFEQLQTILEELKNKIVALEAKIGR